MKHLCKQLITVNSIRRFVRRSTSPAQTALLLCVVGGASASTSLDIGSGPSFELCASCGGYQTTLKNTNIDDTDLLR